MARKKSKKSLLKPILLRPASLILAGFLLMGLGSFWRWQDNIKTFFRPSLAQETNALAAQFLPQTVIIDSLGLKAPIKTGGIIQGKWILEDKAVMVMSLPGKPENDQSFILYAHKRKGLFLELKNINAGDKIILKDQSGKNLTYEVISKENTKPQEISKLVSGSANTLTLFTCEGVFDQSRLIVKAKLI